MVYAKEKQQKKLTKFIKSMICVIGASLIMSLNIKTFVRAGNLIPGGITGLTLLIQRSALTFFNMTLPYSLINISLNAIPVYIGFKLIGKKFTGYSVLVIVLNSLLVDILPGFQVTNNPLLIAIFGGIINGIGISIALAGKASSGGTDFLAVYMSQKYNVPSWNLVLGINICILLIAGMLFGYEAALYSIIFQYASTQMIDVLHKKDTKNTLFIITDNPDTLEKVLLDFTHHGITRFEGKGSYQHEERTLLYTVVTADEVKDIVELIHSIDSNAFINITKSIGVKGRFYTEPLE